MSGAERASYCQALASRRPDAMKLTGIDAAAAMIDVARAAASDPRIAFAVGFAEHLPYPDHRFDVRSAQPP